MVDKIEWICQNVSMPEIDTQQLACWLEQVTKAHDRILGSLVYIFCDDEKILEVNRQFLNHDYYTDIITFDYCRGKLVRGDMYISLDTVNSNAEGLNCSYDSELKRVIVHGLMHLCGINDKAPGEREIMEMHENQALKMLEDLIANNNNQ